jgi:hypothetical protein
MDSEKTVKDEQGNPLKATPPTIPRRKPWLDPALEVAPIEDAEKGEKTHPDSDGSS